ncbi:MAG TPA: hypothetical protein PLY08_08925, partial [Bacillota bacterium]|nr:hypothetical protein [Bacillota bacterium]
MSRISFCNAAFSEIDITPDFQTVLVGCHRPDPRAQGVLHRLYAQAVLFRTDNETFCLLAIDSLGLTRSLANTIRSQIAERLNADVSHVMLNFSHTHSAPEPTPFALNGERYFLFLCSRIILCVESAMERFTACKVGWSYTSAAIGENRRDGCSITDHRLGALMVARADDE